MSDYLTAVIGGVTVAALSGVGFVAYKHPKPYRDLALILLALSTSAYFGSVIWNWSNSTVYAVVARTDLLGAKRDEVARLIEGYQVPGWWLLIYLAFQAYLTFLASLPKWLTE